MSRHPLPANAPCPHGHTEGRNKRSQCITCRRLKEADPAGRRKQNRPAYLTSAGLGWIGAAQKSLRKRRRPGEKCASKRELYALWLCQGGRCALTGIVIDGVPHLDHRVPVAQGGAHTIDNLHWTHPAANMAKLDSTVDEFRAWLLAAADSLRAKMQFEALL